ncbi:MAG: putative bifunctional diguanylate cyclase/phosphodiesterase [Gammaproteobacteria bacterium]
MDVLLVEDDVLDAEMVTQILNRDRLNGYRITHVTTVAQAMDRLESESFDIVLVDLNLPDACDDEAVSRITIAHSQVPVLVLSGNSDPEFATQVIRAGAQDFIVKGAQSTMELARAMSYAVERKSTEMRLKHLASYDPLTNLANRQEFCTQLEKACARADRHGTLVALMVLDLDHFKTINDIHGHHAGDELLCSVAAKLRNGIRTGDTAARLGGDEFAVILEDIPHEQSVMRWARQMLRTLREPISIGNTSHPVSASLGGSMYPTHGRSVDELMRSADMAMYDIKRAGRGNVALYDTAMDERRQRHFDLETLLRCAISNQELVAYYQPKISLVDGSLIGIEALCRWHRSNGEIVEPNEFLPIARRMGLMPEVGRFMLEAVTEQLSLWRSEGGPNVPVSINADAQEVSSPSYASRFIESMKASGLPPTSFAVEITETTLLEPSAVCLDNLDLLRRSGVRIELDDFGAGHATFNYLRQFPLDAIKLDRSLVQGLENDPQCVTIVKAMIGLGEALGLDVIGEGIESPGQMQTLRRIGCRSGQGFFVSKPLPGNRVEQWQKVVLQTLRLRPEGFNTDRTDAAPVARKAPDSLTRDSDEAQSKPKIVARPEPKRASVTPIKGVAQPHASNGQ